jgi:hypothetical protein|tara:strand:- start:225 stop:347 length:123 start_codon:yes stop_codon:yes gene_type:complete
MLGYDQNSGIFISLTVVCLNGRRNRPLIHAFFKIAEKVDV